MSDYANSLRDPIVSNHEQQVEIFTDGSCLGNPGPGGYGIVMRYKQVEKTLARGYRLTTNNRMEMLAAVMALQALKEPCRVILTTDSQYVRQGITQWIHNWKLRGWKNCRQKPVKNADLWQALDKETARHQVEWRWVKGTRDTVKTKCVMNLPAKRQKIPPKTISAINLNPNNRSSISKKALVLNHRGSE